MIATPTPTPIPTSIAPQSCLSDLAIDRLVAHEMTGPDERVAQAHLEQCERCRSRLLAISAESLEFARTAPPLPLVDPRPPAPRAPRPAAVRRRWAAVGSLAAVGGVLLAVGFAQLRKTDPLVASGERRKGDAALAYYVLRGGLVQEGRADAPLFPGDAIQFVYTPPAEGFLAIFSVDGQGKASVYYPSGDQAAAVEPGSRQALPQSTILDGALGRETVYAFFCREPVRLEPLRTRLEGNRNASAPLAPGCVVQTLSFQKQSRR